MLLIAGVLHRRDCWKKPTCLSRSNESLICFCYKRNDPLRGNRYYVRGKVYGKHYIFSKGFGVLSVAALLCGGLAFEEVRRLNKRLKTLPDEFDVEKAPLNVAEVTDIEEARLALQAALTLARSRTSNLSQLKSFLPPLSPSPTNAEDDLKILMTYFSAKGIGQCTKYFMDIALQHGVRALSVLQKEAVWTFEGNDLLLPQTSREPVDKNNLLFLLQAVLGHCDIDGNCTELVRRKGLQMLRRIYEQNCHNKPVVFAVGRIMSIVTLHRWLHQDILKSGWVAIFAEWMRSSDLELSLLATKSLANMDADGKGNCFYGARVYLYHPQYLDREPVLADVVFVHGLLGGPFKTWRQQDRSKNSSGTIEKRQWIFKKRDGAKSLLADSTTKNVENREEESSDKPYTLCWPKDWLAIDCQNLRLLTVEYETRLSDWSVGCPYDSERKMIDVLGKELLEMLEQAGVGRRPIIWVGHSMGGLLIKEMLCIANKVQLLRPLLSQTKGIVFYSVPHRGSSLAAYGRRISYLVYPSVEVRQLMPGSQKLKSLHNAFRELMFEEGIPLLSFSEGQSTNLPFSLQAKIVPEESSDPGFGEFHIMPQLNHLNICKPEDRDAELYRLTLGFIRDCVSQFVTSDHSSPS